MKHHTHSCSGHGIVVIIIGQPFIFVVSNSAQIAHYSKRTLHDIMSKIGQILPNLVRCQQCFYSLWPKSARSSSLCPSRHFLFPEHMKNRAYWAELDSVNLKFSLLLYPLMASHLSTLWQQQAHHHYHTNAYGQVVLEIPSWTSEFQSTYQMQD